MSNGDSANDQGGGTPGGRIGHSTQQGAPQAGDVDGGGGTPPDPRIAELQRQLDLTTLEAKIATEQAKLLEKLLPNADVKSAEGKITLDDKVVVESTGWAYHALRTAAGVIAARVRKTAHRGTTATALPVLITWGDAPVRHLAAFRAFEEEVELLKKMWEAVPVGPPEPQREALDRKMDFMGPGPSALALGTKAVLDLLTYTRKDLDLKGVPVDVPDSTLAACVADRLVDAGVPTSLPQLAPDPSRSPKVGTILDELRKARLAAVARAPEEERDRIKEIGKLHDRFQHALLAVDSDTGESRLASLMLGALVAAALEDGALYLRVWVATAAGLNITETGFLWFKGKIRHGGGAVCGYLLTDASGEVKAADVVGRHSGYHQDPPAFPSERSDG